MIKAAGILFLAPDRTALFLKRSGTGDHAGEWCTPGGKQEDGETTLACAVREATEECGAIPDGDRVLLARRIKCDAETVSAPDASGTGPEVDFTTYVQRVKTKFVPTGGDDESTGFAWASIDAPPEPLHPGCRIVLARLGMDELGVARAMAAGDLVSPQVYENVTLFKVRITGTGVAYRRQGEEFVWRDPALYLTQEFLERCNGLSVIMEHPKSKVLNSKEFANRVIGSIFFPYVDGSEVWGIAKIYDATAAQIMADNQLSTSPAVIFREPVNTMVEIEAGKKLLIEGKPSLLDHLAICERGVWDKGEAPNGVEIVARADADPIHTKTKRAVLTAAALKLKARLI